MSVASNRTLESGAAVDRILDAARACFLEVGYSCSSVHAVAVRMNLPLEALSERFRTRSELYFAVLDQAEGLVFDRLQAVVGPQPTFAGAFQAVLDDVVRLSNADANLIRFLGAASVDLSQQPELGRARRVHWPRRQAFVTRLIEIGLASGELAHTDRLVAADMVTALLMGLCQINDLVPGAQPMAVDGLKRLITGALLRTAPPGE